MASAIAYNPSDPAQAAFLSSLAAGESGGYGNALDLGVGGSNLSGAPTDQYGFPQWGGYGDSHAAGIYQFQPGTWDQVAAQYGLNFQNPADQNAAAWYLAQDTYGQKTGGSLEDALNSGQFSSIQSALAGVWPSIAGSKFVSSLTGQGTSTPTGFDFNSIPLVGPLVSKVTGAVGDSFARIALLVVGAIVILIALWQLLSSTGAVPSPGQTAKVAVKAATV